MKKLILILIVIALTLLAGCASMPTTAAPPKETVKQHSSADISPPAVARLPSGSFPCADYALITDQYKSGKNYYVVIDNTPRIVSAGTFFKVFAQEYVKKHPCTSNMCNEQYTYDMSRSYRLV